MSYIDSEIVAMRAKKIEELRTVDAIVYKAKWERTGLIEAIKQLSADEIVSTAGRIMSMREFGKLIFCHIQDYSGQLQIAIDKATVGDDRFAFFKKYVDIADFIGVKGKLFRTKTNELTVHVDRFELLSKTLRPLPEKWHGISDQETCYRQRYLDLVMNPDSMNRFKLRTKFITTIRNYLERNAFVEVETPILQTKKSGALAKPFVTHHNALDIDIFLRISPETYLKRCIGGGFDRVFEFAKSFRNEGIDPSHLQEFTLLEFYSAYWNYDDLMKFTQEMIQHVIKEITGSLSVTYQGTAIDFSGDWPRYSFRDLIIQHAGIDIDKYLTVEELRQAIKDKGIIIEDADKLGRGNLIDQLYKKVARPKMINPQFLINHPIDLSPLARKNDTNPLETDRFQLVVNTWELINAYSELVDPVDQRQRFDQQAKAHAAGDDDAMEADEDFCLCVDHGLPPIAGWGMGIDRFLALLVDCENLKDVVLFPLMRPIHEKPVADYTSFPEIEALPLNREQAMTLLKSELKSLSLIKHSVAAAGVMEGLARHFKQDSEKWFIIGLLHDLDFEKTEQNPKEHGLLTGKMLADMKFPEIAVQAIRAHNGDNNGQERTNGLDIALVAGETVTGLITATALIYPDKKLTSVQPESVIKRMGKKDFAKNVNRDSIRLIEKTGLTLEQFVDLAITAMRPYAEELGI